jgi:hypothetical protein
VQELPTGLFRFNHVFTFQIAQTLVAKKQSPEGYVPEPEREAGVALQLGKSSGKAFRYYVVSLLVRTLIAI